MQILLRYRGVEADWLTGCNDHLIAICCRPLWVTHPAQIHPQFVVSRPSSSLLPPPPPPTVCVIPVQVTISIDSLIFVEAVMDDYTVTQLYGLWLFL